jgi:dephospho-CoA kinase
LSRLTIALTGGIGSGKSTVSALFAQRGVAIIDADEVSHALTAPGVPHSRTSPPPLVST